MICVDILWAYANSMRIRQNREILDLIIIFTRNFQLSTERFNANFRVFLYFLWRQIGTSGFRFKCSAGMPILW
jgi:hypothetical protein